MNALQASRLVDLGETRYDGQNMLLRGAGSHESPHRSLRIDWNGHCAGYLTNGKAIHCSL
ncbi:MAG: hypothetical protein ACRD0Y_12720 [Terriglobales bacterium]